MTDAKKHVSLCLQELEAGDRSAVDRLLPFIYDDLRQMAGKIHHGDGAQHSLNPTALVHEAYARLVHGAERTFECRRHFMAVAAIAMRQLLSSHAQARRTQKRGGDADRVSFHSGHAFGESHDAFDVVDLDDALTEFSDQYPRQAKVVELRFLVGLSVDEAAEVLEVSPRTVKNDWRMARAWLQRALEGPE